MGRQSPTTAPLPTPPANYDPSLEAKRNTQIEQTINQILARQALNGTTLNLNRLPTSPTGLASGDVWVDSSNGNVLKQVP